MKVDIEWNGKSYEIDTDQRVFITEDNGEKFAMLYIPGLPCPVMIHVFGPHDDKSACNAWLWDGDTIKPTFSPSILTRLTWGEDQREIINHVFVCKGMIRYLNDCTHEYAGKTMELPRLCDWPEEMRLWEE